MTDPKDRFVVIDELMEEWDKEDNRHSGGYEIRLLPGPSHREMSEAILEAFSKIEIHEEPFHRRLNQYPKHPRKRK